MNEDNKKIIDDEIKKKETELVLDSPYIKKIFEYKEYTMYLREYK